MFHLAVWYSSTALTPTPAPESKAAMADVVSLAAAVEVLHSASLVHVPRWTCGGYGQAEDVQIVNKHPNINPKKDRTVFMSRFPTFLSILVLMYKTCVFV